MRDVPATMTDAWNKGMFIGPARPTARVTVQHPEMFNRLFAFTTTYTEKFTSASIKSIIDGDFSDAGSFIDFKHGHKVHNRYYDFLFTKLYRPMEMPNVKSVSWNRGIDQQIADCTVVVSNTRPQPIGTTATNLPTVKAATTRYVAKRSGLTKIDGVNLIAGDRLLVRNEGGAKANQKSEDGVYVISTGAWTKVSATGYYLVTNGVKYHGQIFYLTPTAIDPTTPSPGELDMPGYYTYNRGASKFSAVWSHTVNEWFGMIMPDNLLRTYEGYGSDMSQPAELDPFLVQTGLWMIDSVQMDSSGDMTIKTRDVGRILADQYYMEGVIPKPFLDAGDWQSWDEDFTIDPKSTRIKVTPELSSNIYWIGSGNVAGHTLKMAFDNDPNSYWLSIGNVAPSRRFAYEYVQCKTGNQSVNQVRVRAKKKGYTCYISVMQDGVWQGAHSMNYHRDGIGKNDADIAYVKKVSIDDEKETVITLDKTYTKVQRVRVTFGNLQNFAFGTYHYRAGIRGVEVYSPGTTKTTHLHQGPAGSNPNRYSDYTQIVKLLCAWGGFYWPNTGRQRISNGTGSFRQLAPATYDQNVLGRGVKGRVWGDFQNSGVAGQADLAQDNFLRKSLLDGINYIRDILGFIFFIDETGGCVWRMPNIINRGCLRSAFSADPGYVQNYAHAIDEKKVLLTLSSTIDSKNVRESNFVGDYSGKIGAWRPGYNPNFTGLRRFGVWTDTNFAPKDDTKAAVATAMKEAATNADIITLRQLFTYRQDTIRIPAYPAIQVDDQIRITERVTDEGYLHYVQSIASSMDIATGEWTYDIQTHWLGYDPASVWVWRPSDMSKDGQIYLNLQKAIQSAFKAVDRRADASIVDPDGTGNTTGD